MQACIYGFHPANNFWKKISKKLQFQIIFLDPNF